LYSESLCDSGKKKKKNYSSKSTYTSYIHAYILIIIQLLVTESAAFIPFAFPGTRGRREGGNAWGSGSIAMAMAGPIFE
jgi:hypothetical protein